jgi:hypothetical protein
MNIMTKLLGLLIVIGGIVLGVWLGIFVCFIGGIIQVLSGLPHQTLGGLVPLNATGIAFGVAKILFSGLVGWTSGIVVVGFGAALMAD